MTFYLHDGAVHVSTGSMPEGAVEVPRLPDMFERWNGSTWEVDDRQRADALAGRAHIDEARSLKYVEALAILNGTPLQGGMLSLEAAQKGVDLLEYAQLVIDKRAAFISAELLRQSRQDGSEGDFTATVATAISNLTA